MTSHSNSSTTNKLDLKIGDKYKLIKKVGSGAFGEIYKGQNIKTGEEVAVKLELSKTKFPQLYYEAKLYKIFDGAVGLPKLYFYAQEGDYNCMVIDLLGPSLEDLFEYCRRKFSLKTVLMLAIQMLQRIEFVHQNGFLHRDIKPDNFLIGMQKQQHVIYIIDFGLAKRYKDSKTGRHIPFKDNKSLTGTARYASLNTHLGIEQSRRDDLEQIGIILMYFIRGSLPWQGLPAKNKEEKYEQIKIKKAVTSIEDLTQGYPKEFCHFLNYSRKLKFEERPDYQQVISMFREAFVREGYDFDFMYDWIIKKQALKQRLQANNRNQQKLEEDKERQEKEKERILAEKKQLQNQLKQSIQVNQTYAQTPQQNNLQNNTQQNFVTLQQNQQPYANTPLDQHNTYQNNTQSAQKPQNIIQTQSSALHLNLQQSQNNFQNQTVQSNQNQMPTMLLSKMNSNQPSQQQPNQTTNNGFMSNQQMLRESGNQVITNTGQLGQQQNNDAGGMTQQRQFLTNRQNTSDMINVNTPQERSNNTQQNHFTTTSGAGNTRNPINTTFETNRKMISQIRNNEFKSSAHQILDSGNQAGAVPHPKQSLSNVKRGASQLNQHHIISPVQGPNHYTSNSQNFLADSSYNTPVTNHLRENQAGTQLMTIHNSQQIINQFFGQAHPSGQTQQVQRETQTHSRMQPN